MSGSSGPGTRRTSQSESESTFSSTSGSTLDSGTHRQPDSPCFRAKRLLYSCCCSRTLGPKSPSLAKVKSVSRDLGESYARASRPPCDFCSRPDCETSTSRTRTSAELLLLRRNEGRVSGPSLCSHVRMKTDCFDTHFSLRQITLPDLWLKFCLMHLSNIRFFRHVWGQAIAD